MISGACALCHFGVIVVDILMLSVCQCASQAATSRLLRSTAMVNTHVLDNTGCFMYASSGDTPKDPVMVRSLGWPQCQAFVLYSNIQRVSLRVYTRLWKLLAGPTFASSVHIIKFVCQGFWIVIFWNVFSLVQQTTLTPRPS